MAALKHNLKEIKFQLRHHLFLLERKWRCHPFLSRFYPLSLRAKAKQSLFKRFLAVLLALFILIPTLLIFFRQPQAQAEWFDDNYAYRQKITFTHNADLANTSMRLTVSNTDTLISAGKMQSDCDDSRFTDSNGKVLKFRLVSGCNSASTVFDVIFPTVINGSNLAWLYYGNPSALSASDSTVATGTTPSGSPSFATEEKAPSPALSLKFDEGTGTTAQDSSSNNNDGSISGAAWRTKESCLSGNCLYFDGVDDAVTVTEANSINFSKNLYSGFTFEAWVKINSDGEANTGQIFYKSSGNATWLRVENEGSDGKVDLRAQLWLSISAPTLLITDAIELNKWTHIALSYTDDADDEITIYVNGINRGASTNGMGSLNESAANLLIGGRWDANFHGFIDEFKIYPYERSASQIGADYSSKTSSVHGLSASFGDDQSYLSNGLVGWWKMDDGVNNPCASGVDKACDSSGNGNVGTWTNGVASTSGKFGNATNYDGSNDYVSVPDSSSLYSNTLTISAWINSDAWDASQPKYIVSKRTSRNEWALVVDSSGYLTFYAWNADDTTTVFNLSSSVSISAGSGWHFVSATTDGTTARIFVDGNSTGSSSTTGTIQNTASDITIGSCAGGACPSESLRYFDGKIDDVRVYNRALSPSEITGLYDWAPGPLGWWKMDENTGQSAYDSSGNTYTGTLGSGGSADSSDPVWTRGKFGSALKFDGVNDYVDTTSTTAFNFERTQAFSVSAWIKSNWNGSDYEVIAANMHATTIAGYELFIDGTLTGKPLGFAILNSGATEYLYAQDSSRTNLLDNQWHHVQATYDGSSNVSGIKLYIDGIAKPAAQYLGNTTLTTSILSNTSLKIGKRMDSTPYPFLGLIDDVRVYNYARTSKQTVSDMNAGHPSVGSPVGSAIVHYKFDEGYATTTRSYGSCATCSATLTNMDSPATYGSGWTSNGKFGKAVNLDGTNDYVSLIDNIETILGANPDSYSYSAWFRTATTTGYAQIISDYNFGGVDLNYGMNLFFLNGALRANVRSSGNTYNTSPDISGYNDNNWHLATVTVDKSTLTQNLYVDGILKATVTIGNYDYIDSVALFSGASYNGSYVNLLPGTIDDVRVYGYALNADEIKVLYNQGQAAVWGASGTNADGRTASDSAARAYCPPGNSQTNCAGTGVLDPAPYGEWKFDENTGQSAYDSSGKANTGNLGIDANPGSDDPTWTRGKFGPALKFDGVDDYVETANTIGITGSSSRTLSAWVYIDSFNVDCWNVVATYGGYVNYQSFGIIYDCNSMNFNGFGLGDFDSNLTVTTKTWYHMVVTYDGTTVRTFLNGIEGTSKALALSTGSSSLGIGANLLGGSHYTPYAIIDDVRLYNYARTPAQIAWDYNRGKPVGWWKFDECAGPTAHDASGNTYNATIYPVTLGNTAVGTCNSGTSTDMWNDGTTGKFNASLGFDGSDDYAQISDTANLRFDTNSQDYSLFAWIKRTTTGTEYILSKEDADNDGWRMMLNASNQVLCSEDATDVTSASTITDTNWHHIGCTIDRDGNGQVYIDGSASGSTVSMGSDAMATTSNIRIGTRSYTSTNYFNGSIDDVRIYNYVLSPAQIRTLYNENSALKFGPSTGSP